MSGDVVYLYPSLEQRLALELTAVERMDEISPEIDPILAELEDRDPRFAYGRMVILTCFISLWVLIGLGIFGVNLLLTCFPEVFR